ncbi:class D sortase [Anaerobacillus sp. MEB173]|uniref:class D sortase n=1 Tax=Anaerobacillus sp. MEB173 TaxID=3383345 RepID=UPI003F9287E1
MKTSYCVMRVGSLLLCLVGFLYFSYNISLFMKSNQLIESNRSEVLTEQFEETNKQAAFPKEGEYIGRLAIPSLNMEWPIYYGTRENELLHGVGYYPGSAFPGQNNNTVLAGHRDTVFKNLKDVSLHDTIIIHLQNSTYNYRVKKIRIVNEDDQSVIVPKPSSTLTLVTCYPFDFIGSAKQRYVLIAEQY